MAGTNTKKRTRCPNGTRRNPKTGNCESKKAKSGVNTKKLKVNTNANANSTKNTKKRSRCSNGMRKNPKTGKCEATKNISKKVYKYKVKAKPGPKERKQKKAMQNELMELSRPYQAHKKAQIEKKRLAKLIKANNLQRAKAELKGGSRAGHEDYLEPIVVTRVKEKILSSFERLRLVQYLTEVPTKTKPKVDEIHKKIKSVLQASVLQAKEEGKITAQGKKQITDLITALRDFDVSEIFYLVNQLNLDATTPKIYYGFTKIETSNAIILYEQNGKYYFSLLNFEDNKHYFLNDRLAIEAEELLIDFYFKISSKFHLESKEGIKYKEFIDTMARKIRKNIEEIQVGAAIKYKISYQETVI